MLAATTTKTDDESDAVAVGVAWLRDRENLQEKLPPGNL